MSEPHYTLRLPALGEGVGFGGKPIWERAFLDYHLQLDPTIFALTLGGSGGSFYIPQPNPDLPPLLRFRPVLQPPTPGWLKPLPPAPSGLPWNVPSVSPRPATGGDLASAVVKVPQVSQAIDHVEALGQAELKRVWKGLKTGDGSAYAETALAALAVIGVGFAGAKLAYEKDITLPALPSIPLGIPGLSVQLKYDDTVRGLVDNGVQTRKISGTVTLDLKKLVPALK